MIKNYKHYLNITMICLVLSLALVGIASDRSEAAQYPADMMMIVASGDSIDISGSFTDTNFKQAVWEWLGNPTGSSPEAFTRADLINRMDDMNYTLDVEAEGISSLDGLENFDGTGLNVFDCRNNQIEVMPALPASLTELYCAQNSLGSLPELPAGLIILGCAENDLTSLPAMPANLNLLGCANNQLSSLPDLPGTLTDLLCYYNNLTELPALPGGLKNLYCANNKLNSLPALPASLNVLWCFNNNLSALPGLPAGLTELKCYYNNLESLPDLPPNLVILACANNRLVSLPELPTRLTELMCFNNQLTKLPELSNTALTNLYCANNQLRGLPALPASLKVLWCFNNNLISLPTLPPDLTDLKCEQNYLNVFTGVLKSMIDGCQAATKTFTPQYSCIYTGSGLTLVTGDTSQVTSGSLSLEESSDGTTWSFISTADLIDFTFNSSDSSVATVDSGGKITAVSPGTCGIYALYKNIGSEYTRAIIPVTVSEPATVVLQGISLNSDLDLYSMKAGETYNIIVTANYSDGSSQDVTADAIYKTSNRKVATVNSSGLVTGNSAGNAVITVKYNNFTAQVNIEVVKVVLTGISLDTQFCSLKTGETHSITVTANYSDGSSRIVTADAGYRTSNRKVATVNASGVIAGNKPGSAVITVKCNNITARVTVNVTN